MNMINVNKHLLGFASASVLTTALLFSTRASADLIVNTVPNASWNNSGTMSYTSDPTDPTTQSGGENGQYELTGGGSLTMNSGTLSITNTAYGFFIGQNGSAGTLTVNGGTFTWNSSGLASAIANTSNATGMVNISAGTVNLNLGASSLVLGRQGGSASFDLTGTGLFTSNAEYFGMGGEYSGSNIWQNDGGGTNRVTLGAGSAVFELTGLGGDTTANFNINTASSAFNFLTGSDGEISINGADAAFYDGLISAGDIQINGAADTNASDFTFSTSGGQGVLELATAPEPSVWAMMFGGLAALLAICRFRRMA
jgi:hypothetical protein